MRALQVWLAAGVLSSVFSIAGCSGDTPVDALEKARDYLEAGNLPAAQIELKNAVAADPGLAEARRLLGSTYIRMDMLLPARKELLKAWELGVRDEEAVSDLLDVMLARDRKEKVLGWIETAVGEIEDACLAGGLRARALLHAGDLLTAEKVIGETLAADADCTLARYAEAEMALRRDDKEKAERLFRELEPPGILELQRRMALARLLSARGAVEEAQSLLRETIEAWPYNPQPRILLGWIALEANDWERLAETLEAMPERVRKAYPAARFLAGLLQLHRNDLVGARDALLSVEAVYEDHPLWQRTLGYIHAQLGEREQAIGLLAKYFDTHPGDWKAGVLLARLLASAQRGEPALEILEHLVHDEAGGAAVALEFAVAATSLRAHERLIQLEPLLLPYLRGEDKKTAARLAALLGRARLEVGDLRGSVEDFAFWLRHEESFERPGAFLLQVYLRNGWLDEARQLLSEIEKERPKDPFVRNARGILYLAAGEKQSARALFEELIREHPEYLEARMNLASLLIESGDLEGAKRQLRAAIDAEPQSVRAHVQLAGLLIREGDPDEGLELLERASRLAGDKSFPIDLLLVQEYLRAGREEQALEKIRAIRERRGDVPVLAIAETRAHLAGGRIADAVQATAQALATHRDLASLRQALAAMLASRKEDREALLDTLEASWQRWPSSGLLVVMAEVRGGLGEPFPEALARKWLRERPNDLAVRERYAAHLILKGDLEQAAGHYRAILERHDAHLVALNNLAFIETRLGNLDAAVEYAERAFEAAPDNGAVLDTLGWSLVHAGRLEEGLEKLRQAVERLPDNGEIRLHLAWALAASGALDEASAQLDSALRLDPSLAQREAAREVQKRLSGLRPQQATTPEAR